MKKGIFVHSEIGQLKSVLLHRPGWELENLTPDLLERLLFDDIPDLRLAQKEHDVFVQKLHENGVQVYYLERMLAEVFDEDETLKLQFLEQFLNEAKLESKIEQRKKLRVHLLSVSNLKMVEIIIAGVETRVLGVKNSDNYPFVIDPMPNALFQRDPAAFVYDGVCLNKMKSETRNRETLISQFVLKYHPLFKNQIQFYYDRQYKDHLEGGDVMVLNKKTLVIGCTERSSFDAIEKLAKNLFAQHQDLKIVVLDIPKKRAFMHLDTVLTHIDHDKFIVHPLIFENLSQFKIFEMTSQGKKQIHLSLIEYFNILIGKPVTFIRCGGDSPIHAAREQWNDGTNVLTISPGKVISYSRNHITNGLLRQAGIEVIEVPSSELSRGRGGPRCMSMPIWRELV